MAWASRRSVTRFSHKEVDILRLPYEKVSNGAVMCRIVYALTGARRRDFSNWTEKDQNSSVGASMLSICWDPGKRRAILLDGKTKIRNPGEEIIGGKPVQF